MTYFLKTIKKYPILFIFIFFLIIFGYFLTSQFISRPIVFSQGDQIIPSDRKIDWNPGIPGGLPNYPIGTNVLDYGAVGNGIANDTGAIQAAINACPEGRAVYIPEGTYRTTGELRITKGIVLRGAGPGKSKIKLDTSATANVIRIYGSGSSGSAININSGYTKDSTNITVANASTIAVNDYIVVYQDNKSGLATPYGYGSNFCRWCGDNSGSGSHLMAQIVRVTAKNANTLTINRPLYFTFEASLDPEIKEINMLERAGLEDLYLEQVVLGGSYSSSNNVYVYACANCWVDNIESYKPVGAHVLLRNSYACEIRDSYLHEGHINVSGRTYGVFLMFRNSDHLIENNIIRKSRHAMAFEGGGSGNVFGYNYAVDGLDSDDPYWVTHDAITHGAHPYMNLFEGNIHEKIGHDNTFGSSSHNTHLRNYVTRGTDEKNSGLWAVDIQANNYYENLIGNILCREGCSGTLNYGDGGSRRSIYKLGYSSPGDTSGPDDSRVESTLLRHGNFDYVTDNTQWDSGIPNHNLPASLYLDSKPAFFGSVVWPPIGPDVAGLVNKIPAQLRYEAVTAQRTCQEQQGTCCNQGQICQNGNFLPNTDCDYCCVGGSCQSPLLGDLNSDSQVNSEDLPLLIAKWLQGQNIQNEDLNDDNKVDARDLGMIMSQWTE